MTNQEIISLMRSEYEVEILEKEVMSKHCSIQTGGKSTAVILPTTINDLKLVLKLLKSEEKKYKIIGRGSNIVLPSVDLDVFFIKISNVLCHLNVFDNGEVDVGAGFPLQKLAKNLSKKGLTGLEFAGGIPGTMGGAVFMNAGAHTQEIKDIVQKVIYLDENLDVKELDAKDCNFSYRHSIFQENNGIIISVILSMSYADPAVVFKKMLGNLEYRKEMQPLSSPTFGSVFKNPDGQHAGKLIEESGLKGYVLGGAKISEKHANFIENFSCATNDDIIDLINHIKSVVKKKKNVDLFTEVEIYNGDNFE